MKWHDHVDAHHLFISVYACYHSLFSSLSTTAMFTNNDNAPLFLCIMRTSNSGASVCLLLIECFHVCLHMQFNHIKYARISGCNMCAACYLCGSNSYSTSWTALNCEHIICVRCHCQVTMHRSVNCNNTQYPFVRKVLCNLQFSLFAPQRRRQIFNDQIETEWTTNKITIATFKSIHTLVIAVAA